MNLMTLTDKQLDLIRRTVARDCDPAEFDQFIHICKAVSLDPLRRQIYAFVFNKDNPKYRRMSVVTGIDGYRAIAERTKCYRPDETAPRITYDDAGKNPASNPLGIVRAEVTVFKYAQGAWFPVTGEAYWDEYVPIKNGTIDERKENWRKMARVMISKCAEAQALRRAWPDDFSGLAVEEEIDRQMIDITPSEAADQAASEAKLNLIGGKNALTIDWLDGKPLARVPASKFPEAVLEFANRKDVSATELRVFWHRNLPARGEYKALHGSDYLALQKEIEALTERKENAEVNQDAAE
jgi:phage recombination protein Bet